ncbi:hypothetical protein [Nocardioides sp. CFH 31398]|uniref:hypothetical protein n=1 Tax=Nocardioides sp. CFH 31398 TaxID=2919579 RepID=UPI001F06D45D|nr:hypothetical protein [Nocardioides sp. CFH 31398]MCH1868233.1 hypothetical protein [Nocardioides sp. CFH 31398]
MDRSKEDALWRAIVENYGERADLDDATTDRAADRHTGDGASVGSTETASEAAEASSEDQASAAGTAEPVDGADHQAARDAEAARREREFEAQHEVPERFVPPEPPPLPYVPPSRLLAWCLMVGGPLLLLLSLVLDFWLPGIIQLLAVAGFVGGFVYLVVRMPRDPRDPWDDGARV